MAHARFTAAHAAADGALVRAGDPASLGRLFARYRPRLLALALSLLGYRTEAEDAVHDAFVTALARLPQLADAQAVGGWLHAIVRNRCLMELRRRAAAPVIDDSEAAALEHAAEDGIERQVENAQLRDWVWSALHRLPEAQRTVVMLRYFGSYDSYGELATILGVPVGTVRSRLAEAKRHLAELLLDSAGRADASALAEQREREHLYASSYAALYRGERSAFLAHFAPDIAVRWPGGHTTRGRGHFEADLDDDLRAGVRVQVRRVLASGETTVLEAALINPPAAPQHCPPGGAMVLFHGPRQVTRMHLHLAARPPAPG